MKTSYCEFLAVNHLTEIVQFAFECWMWERKKKSTFCVRNRIFEWIEIQLENRIQSWKKKECIIKSNPSPNTFMSVNQNEILKLSTVFKLYQQQQQKKVRIEFNSYGNQNIPQWKRRRKNKTYVEENFVVLLLNILLLVFFFSFQVFVLEFCMWKIFALMFDWLFDSFVGVKMVWPIYKSAWFNFTNVTAITRSLFRTWSNVCEFVWCVGSFVQFNIFKCYVDYNCICNPSIIFFF